jgi:hypothetical protein
MLSVGERILKAGPLKKYCLLVPYKTDTNTLKQSIFLSGVVFRKLLTREPRQSALWAFCDTQHIGTQYNSIECCYADMPNSFVAKLYSVDIQCSHFNFYKLGNVNVHQANQ